MLLLYDMGRKLYFFVIYLVIFLRKMQNFGLANKKN